MRETRQDTTTPKGKIMVGVKRAFSNSDKKK